MSRLPHVAVVLLFLAVLLRSELVGAVALTLITAILLSRLWMRQVERALRVRREVPEQLPFGEEATVVVRLQNPTLIRVPWVELRESVPLGLRIAAPQPSVVTLGAGAEHQIVYRIRGSRRGWYSIGPLRLALGDVLGLRRLQLTVPSTNVIVYPRIVPLTELGLPAALGLGPLAGQRIEDPARPAGVRQYVPGDDVRRLDWKSTARQNTLLVRTADPTIAPETTIALAFGLYDYPAQIIQEATERAISVAASLAVALLARKLPVSVVTNGHDPQTNTTGVALGFGKGEGQRRLLLSLLGRLVISHERLLWDVVQMQPLPWGGTLALVLADLTLDTLPQIMALRRRGQQVLLLLIEASPTGLALAQQQHLRAYSVDRRGRPLLERRL